MLYSFTINYNGVCVVAVYGKYITIGVYPHVVNINYVRVLHDNILGRPKGNSILVEIGENEYLWIKDGGPVMFKSLCRMRRFMILCHKYMCSVAFDEHYNYYLLNEQVTILARNSDQLHSEPDVYYTANSRICSRGEDISDSILSGFDHIMAFYSNDNRLDLNYSPTATAELENMTIIKSTGMCVPVTNERMREIMSAAGKYAGFVPIIFTPLALPAI